jgi:DNA-binding transcriptional MerR regulator/methylmalonyl-CoA mutase cobalamin-binding subunit
VNENLLRIGELSRRTGVSPEVLRAWERRYGLFSPQRTEGGFRLYSAADVARVNAMKRLVAAGVSASEAARRVAWSLPDGVDVSAGTSLFDERRDALRHALVTYDEASAHALIDRLLMEFDAETLMRSALLPVLHEIGELWGTGRISIAEEHFASNLIRRRLGGLARGWDNGAGPRAIIACPPDEEHDIPLLMFGIALGNRGWRITYLGQRTPAEDLLKAVDALRPQLVVLGSPRADAYNDLITPLRNLVRGVQVAIGGAGATADLAQRMGAILLEGDPISAAARVASRNGSRADDD